MTERNRDHRAHAYERMLERLHHAMENARLHEAIETVKEQAVELGELTREEAERIGNFLRRDVEDAARYSAATDDDFRGWLRMDLRMVESWLWDRFSSVADKTRLELMELQRELQQSSAYHAGEITGPGTLACSNCGELIRFKQAEQIPRCPKCQGSVYRRVPAPAPDNPQKP
ncbi:MAG TPA: zinc ribbon-containing protein [Nitrococcus sp.]|nr:zinc ribbon-containing protein [Nitrococcus sp.]